MDSVPQCDHDSGFLILNSYPEGYQFNKQTATDAIMTDRV